LLHFLKICGFWVSKLANYRSGDKSKQPFSNLFHAESAKIFAKNAKEKQIIFALFASFPLRPLREPFFYFRIVNENSIRLALAYILFEAGLFELKGCAGSFT
jgi:hypothetical protein